MEIFPSIGNKIPVYEIDIVSYLSKEDMDNGNVRHQTRRKIAATCGSDLGTWIKEDAKKSGFSEGKFEEDGNYVNFIAHNNEGRFLVYSYHETEDSIDRVIIEDAVALRELKSFMDERKRERFRI